MDPKDRIAALLREREGYERSGKPERAAEVTEQLQALGHEAKAPARRAEKRPRKTPSTTEKR